MPRTPRTGPSVQAPSPAPPKAYSLPRLRGACCQPTTIHARNSNNFHIAHSKAVAAHQPHSGRLLCLDKVRNTWRTTATRSDRMAPPSGLHQSAIPSDFDAPFPPLVRSSTVPDRLTSHRADPAHLAPEDAYAPLSPLRHPAAFVRGGSSDASGPDSRPRRLRRDDTSRSRSRRRKRFQKLLWVKQSCTRPLPLRILCDLHTQRV